MILTDIYPTERFTLKFSVEMEENIPHFDTYQYIFDFSCCRHLILSSVIQRLHGKMTAWKLVWGVVPPPPLPFLWSQNLNTPCPTDMSPPAGLQQFQVSLLTGLPSKQCLLAGKWQIGSCTITVIHKRLFPGAFYKRLKKTKQTNPDCRSIVSNSCMNLQKKKKITKLWFQANKNKNKSKHI